MLFFSPLIGLEFTGETIRAVIARRSFLGVGRRKGAEHILMQAEVNIPEKTLENGVIKDREKCAEALEELFTNMHLPMRHKKVMLCLPPSKVYTTAITLPSFPRRKEERDDLIRGALADIVPEESLNLSISSKVLHTKKDAVTIGVAAIENEVLKGYLDLCTDASLDVRGVTSGSLALAMSLVDAGDAPFLLVQGGTKKGGGCVSVTLFDALWPVDEEVLPGETKNERVIEAVKSLLTDARNKNQTIERLLVHGGAATINGLRAANVPDLLVEEALPALKLSEKKWAAALAASAFPPHLSVHLLSESKSASGLWVVVLLALLGMGSLATLAAALFL